MARVKYKNGTCFGCQKCLYCNIDLKKDTCNCKKTVKPTKKNRTDLVKNAYPRAFKPASSNSKQLDYVKNKNECFQYGYDLKKTIQFSLCTTCNSFYQRLSDSNSSRKTGKSEETEATEVIDLEADSSEVSTTITQSEPTKIQSESKHDSEIDDEDDAELEMEINYKLVIKQADGSILPAKNYLVTISELDEFLLAIQNNITVLLGDEEINANDYNVSFKPEKAQGAGTLLVDVCDFKNFQLEYIKLAAANKVMLILVTIKKKEKLVNKRKKKVNLLLYFIIF